MPIGPGGTGLNVAALRGEFFNSYAEQSVYWQELSTRIVSTGHTERYRWLGSVPHMREWVSGRQAKGLRAESYDVANHLYEATLEVAREEVEDDQLGQINIRVRELAQRAADHKDYLLEQLLINGETSGFNAYDGHAFFSDAHESGGSGAQSNLLTYGAVDPDEPTVAEFRGALGQAIAQMVALKDDQGLPMRIKPTPAGFVVIVPPTMLLTAMEALNLQFVPDAVEGLKPNIVRAAARVMAFPGLTDESKWYLAKVDVPVRPFIFQDRVPIEFSAMGGSEDLHVFTTDRCLFGVRARYAMTYGYWQYCARTDFT